MNTKLISLLLVCSAAFSGVQCTTNKEFLKKRILFRDDVGAALAVLNDGSGSVDAPDNSVLPDASTSAATPAAPTDPVVPVITAAPAASAPATPADPVMGAFEYDTSDLQTIRKITSLLSLIDPITQATTGVTDLTCAGVDTIYRQAYALTSAALEGETLEARVGRVLGKINSLKQKGNIFKWKKAVAQSVGIEALVAVLVEVAHNYSGQGISKLLPHDEQRLLRRAVRATTGAAVETAAELAAYKLQEKLELRSRRTTLKGLIADGEDGDPITAAVGAAFAEKLIQNLTYQILGEILLAGANDVQSRDYVADLKATLSIKH